MNHFCEKTVLQRFQFVDCNKLPRRELNSGHDDLDFFVRYVHLYVAEFVYMYPLFWYVCYFFNLEFVWLLYVFS
jgi:hypothetical protein